MVNIIICILTIACLAWFCARELRYQSRYRYERNPYRRWCKRCGQCQVVYARFDDSTWGWVTQGGVHEPLCGCHNDTKD